MQRLSPLMKGLVQTRARADAGLLKAIKSVAHRTEYLNQLTAAFERKANKLQQSINNEKTIADEALLVRNACDQFIQQLTEGIDPQKIKAVDGWQGRYGPRGALGNAVKQLVQAAYPNAVTTKEVAASIQQQYSLTFETPAERREWKRVSIRGRLAYLHRAGYIERLHDLNSSGVTAGLWRWAPADHSNTNLQTLAAQAGLHTTHAHDQDYRALENPPEEDDLPR